MRDGLFYSDYPGETVFGSFVAEKIPPIILFGIIGVFGTNPVHTV